MSHFFRNGNTFRVADNNAVEVHDQLPCGNYIVKQDPFKNFFLEMVEGFSQVSKLYGDTEKNSDRIINTFIARDVSTGVLLNGEKGSGKSLLAKTLCIDAAKLKIPTIIINQPWVGDDFNKLIQDINQPAVILFDEFEKTYDSDSQEQMLTLLDGVFPTKKLFVLTCNDKYRVDRHMRNRPGRIFYMLEFKGLDTQFIREYCEDNLLAKEHIGKICDIAMLFDQFNFDMLKALVEEMNRYNDTPQQALKMLNAKPEFGGDVKYDVMVTYKGAPVRTYKQWEGNPMTAERIRFDFEINTEKKKQSTAETGLDVFADEDENYINVMFSSSDLVSILPQDGVYTFRKDECECTLTRQKQKYFHWDAL